MVLYAVYLLQAVLRMLSRLLLLSCLQAMLLLWMPRFLVNSSACLNEMQAGDDLRLIFGRTRCVVQKKDSFKTNLIFQNCFFML